ncbi:MAG: glycosyltransferase family A protein [Gelidibacter sp.]
MPFFSVIIPLYNKEKHIKTTLDSVLAQTFNDFEVIIVNDGSTDKSLKIAETFDDKRIHIHTTENKGVSYARNYGVSKSNSNLIAFLDADDYWFPHHLKDLKHLIKKFPNCGLYCKAYDAQKNNAIQVSNFKNIPKGWLGIVANYFNNSMSNNLASSSSVVIPKTVFSTLNGFNTNYNSGEDTDLWIRIALKYPVAFDDNVSCLLNLDANNKVTHTKLSQRQHINFDSFNAIAETNQPLKKFLDINRVSVAIQYKLEGATTLEKKAKKTIDFKNLSRLQKLLLKLPRPLVKLILSSRNVLRNFGVDLRLFR